MMRESLYLVGEKRMIGEAEASNQIVYNKLWIAYENDGKPEPAPQEGDWWENKRV